MSSNMYTLMEENAKKYLGRCFYNKDYDTYIKLTFLYGFGVDYLVINLNNQYSCADYFEKGTDTISELEKMIASGELVEITKDVFNKILDSVIDIIKNI